MPPSLRFSPPPVGSDPWCLEIRPGILALLAALVLLVACSEAPQENPESTEALRALPYLAFAKERGRAAKPGVSFDDPAAAATGFNLYTSHLSLPGGAFLLDMSGQVVHQWHLDQRPDIIWQFAKLDRHGHLYALLRNEPPLILDRHLAKRKPSKVGHGSLVKLDWNSKVLLKMDGKFHHDIAIAAGDSVIAIEQSVASIQVQGQKVEIINDHLIHLSPEGGRTPLVDLFALLENQEFVQEALRRSVSQMAVQEKVWQVDLLHANTIEVLQSDIEGVASRGDYLVAVRNLDRLLIISAQTKEILWIWGASILDRPHDPTLLENGNLLIFDNGMHRGFSRVLELNPRSKTIVWSYNNLGESDLFTKQRGGSQRLANGNTLITESNRGRVLEVTPSGQKVWEWFSPSSPRSRRRACVFRMIRIEPGDFPDFLTRYSPR